METKGENKIELTYCVNQVLTQDWGSGGRDLSSSISTRKCAKMANISSSKCKEEIIALGGTHIGSSENGLFLSP